MTRVALVSGANRGIGREVARALAQDDGMVVVGGMRDPAAALPGGVSARRLDVTDARSVDDVVLHLEREHGRLDVLVNNAGIYPGGRAATMDMEVAEETWQVNALGAWRLAVATIPLLRNGQSPRIVNVSSEAGSLQSMHDFTPAYNVSKAALNAITRVLADGLRNDRILVNSVCPGWVRTDMGGPGAPRSVQDGAASVLWAARLGDDGPTGGFFRDGQPVPW
jgi:NAD(P)-dependent dehydrogenase (short-subunit alcohol dehydrogenase family)